MHMQTQSGVWRSRQPHKRQSAASTYSILPISVQARTASARERAASTCEETLGENSALWHSSSNAGSRTNSSQGKVSHDESKSFGANAGGHLFLVVGVQLHSVNEFVLPPTARVQRSRDS